jgi:hypothetical protein
MDGFALGGLQVFQFEAALIVDHAVCLPHVDIEVRPRAVLSGVQMVHMMRTGQAKYACNQQLSLAEQFHRLVA